MRFKNAIKNIGMGLLLQVLTALNSLFVSRLILSEFGSGVNGLVMSITQFLSYASLLEAGIGGIIRAELYRPLAEKCYEKISTIIYEAKKYFHKIALFSLLYFIALAIIFPFTVKSDFSWLYIFSLVCIMCISTFCEYFFCMTYINLLSADQKIWVINGLNCLVMVLSMIISYIAIKSGLSIQMVKVMGIIVFMIKPLFYSYYVSRNYKIKNKTYNQSYHIKQKGSAFIHNIALFIFNNTDIALITFVLGVKEVSVYSVYFSVASGMERLVTAISNGCSAGLGDLIARDNPKQLSQVFNQVEVIQGVVSVILFTTASVLILPFVYIYTSNVTDIEYIRPIFACVLLFSQFIYCTKNLYSIIILNAGHYKQTKRFAILEALCNIILSVFLVKMIGIVGVVIGTLIAELLRLILDAFYLKNNILFRSPIKIIKLISIDLIILIASYCVIGSIDYDSFTWIIWFKQALIAVTIVSLITILVYYIFYNNECRAILNRILKKGN